MSFRRKLLLSYLGLFVVIIAILYPISGQVVRRVVQYSLTSRTQQIVNRISDAPNLDVLVQRLQKLDYFIFFRVTLFDSSGRVLYDSRIDYIQSGDLERSIVAPDFDKTQEYSERYSQLLDQDLAYVSRAFSFQGETLTLRTAFPLSQVEALNEDFRIGLLALGTLLLVLFGVLATLITYHFSRPIQQIIEAVRPYQMGEEEHLPRIELERHSGKKDEFARLGRTLNSLSEKIEAQIAVLTEERNERASILESLIEGVVAVDGERRIIYANHAAKQLLNLSQEGLDSIFPTEPSELSALLGITLSKREIVQEMVQLEEGHKRRFYEVVVLPQNGHGGAIVVLQDQTHHYALLEMRKDFIANASHELKTPLTIIHGFAEALHEQPDMERDTVKIVTEKIARNCQRMEKLVRNLLRLADIEHLPLSNLERIRLNHFFDECRAVALAAYPDAEIEIELPKQSELLIWADSELLELAITNLLFNAAKYSEGAAHITLRVILSPDGKSVEILVQDRGIGIPEEDLPHIFQRFYTVDKAHSRKLGGSGLGLSIVETIVRKHFGSISVESTLGEGTVFSVRLPLHLNQLLAPEKEGDL